jgi:hypothetical protein
MTVAEQLHNALRRAGRCGPQPDLCQAQNDLNRALWRLGQVAAVYDNWYRNGTTPNAHLSEQAIYAAIETLALAANVAGPKFERRLLTQLAQEADHAVPTE